LRIDREFRERLRAGRLLLFLSHRGPDVGVHDVRAGDGFARVAVQRDVRVLLGAREQRGIGIVAFGAREGEIEAEPVRGVEPGVRHVVAVADPRDLLALVGAEVLPHRDNIGEDLARMLKIGEAVDHRNIGVERKLVDVAVGVRADHDAVNHARAGSAMASPRPIWMARSLRKIPWPPSWLVPTSNATRVLVLDLRKIMARIFPTSGLRTCTPRFMRSVREKRPISSSLVKSGMVMKSRWGWPEVIYEASDEL